MSTNTFDPEDPRLTAFALGEASPAEHQAIEELVVDSPEARAAVEQIRQLARDLEEDFARQNTASQEARSHIAGTSKIIAFPARHRRWKPTTTVGWKIAAGLAGLGTALALITHKTVPAIGTTAQIAIPQAPFLVEHPDEASTRKPAGTLPPAKGLPLAAAMVQNELIDDGNSSESPGSGSTLDRTSARAEPENEPSTGAPSRVMAAHSIPVAAAPTKAARRLDEQVLRDAIVRIRLADGTFSGGVVVSADGNVFLARGPKAGEATEVTVILPDGRELANAVSPIGPERRWWKLNVKESGLARVSLARSSPLAEAPLTILHVGERDGAVSFRCTMPIAAQHGVLLAENIGETDTVFSPAGEMLLAERLPQLAGSTSRLKDNARHELAGRYLVRPFAPEEAARITSPER